MEEIYVCPVCGKEIKIGTIQWESLIEIYLNCKCGYNTSSNMYYTENYTDEDIEKIKQKLKRVYNNLKKQ